MKKSNATHALVTHRSSHSPLKSKWTWAFLILAVLLLGSISAVTRAGTGPLSFLTKTPTIARVDEGIGGSVRTVSKPAPKPASNSNPAPKVTEKPTSRWVEKNGVMYHYTYDTNTVKDTPTQKAVTTTIKVDTFDNDPVTTAGIGNAGPVTTSYSSVVTKVNKDDEGKEVSRETTINKDDGSSHTYLTTPPVPTPPQPMNNDDCPAGQEVVFTSKGNHCIPSNGDSTACGIYAYSQNNKCYKIGDEVSGGYKVCDWTVGGRPGVNYAFLSTNCPTKTVVNPGMPKNATECSTSTTHPGWWSDAENTCIQVGSQVTNSPLIVCGAGQRTDKPQYNYPTLSTPEVCPSYIPPVVIPPAPAALSNEELKLRQEDCRSSLKKYDIASGACIDLVKCTPVPLTTGAKSYTTCGSDGKIELKICNNPAGFDANGLCPVTPPVAAPITPNAPSEEFRCGEKGGTWKNGQCQSSKATPVVIDPIKKITNPDGIVGAYANDRGECKYGNGAVKQKNGQYACPTDTFANPVLNLPQNNTPPTTGGLSPDERGEAKVIVSDPEKCNLFSGACGEGKVCSNRLFGGDCIVNLAPPKTLINNGNSPDVRDETNSVGIAPTRGTRKVGELCLSTSGYCETGYCKQGTLKTLGLSTCDYPPTPLSPDERDQLNSSVNSDTTTNPPAVTDPKAVVIPPPAVGSKPVTPEQVSNFSTRLKDLLDRLFPASAPITPTTGPSGADPSKPDQDTQPSTSTSTFSNLSTRITNFIKEAVSTFKSTSQTTPTLEGRDNRESCSQQYQQKCEQGEDGKWYPSYEQNTTTAPAN